MGVRVAGRVAPTVILQFGAPQKHGIVQPTYEKIQQSSPEDEGQQNTKDKSSGLSARVRN